MYFHGDGVARDYTRAAALFKLAADQGDAMAQRSLAGMYFDGVGVAQDRTRAAALFKLAADQGDPVAQCKLGSLYFEGVGERASVRRPDLNDEAGAGAVVRCKRFVGTVFEGGDHPRVLGSFAMRLPDAAAVCADRSETI